MTELALRTIRLLRWLPLGPSFSEHLDRCAALVVFYGPYGAPPLRFRHIVGIAPLPSFSGISLSDPGYEWVDLSDKGNYIASSSLTPSSYDSVGTKRLAKTLH